MLELFQGKYNLKIMKLKLNLTEIKYIKIQEIWS